MDSDYEAWSTPIAETSVGVYVFCTDRSFPSTSTRSIMTIDTEPTFDAVITVHDSAFIQGLVYDFRTLTMDVQMKSGIYRYTNVTPLEFAMLVTSRSTGTTFNAVIKGQKTCTKLDKEKL